MTSAMNTGTPMARQPLGDHLQRDGLAGAGGAGDQAVAVGERRQQESRVRASRRWTAMGRRVGHSVGSGRAACRRGAAGRLAAAFSAPCRAVRVRRADACQNDAVFCYNCARHVTRNGLGTAHFFLGLRPNFMDANGIEHLGELLERTVPPMGYELVDWESVAQGRARARLHRQAGGRRRRGLRARVSNHLTRLFAVENVDFERLEVSSPGLDRPLKKAGGFRALRGRGGRARRCATPVDEREAA